MTHRLILATADLGCGPYGHIELDGTKCLSLQCIPPEHLTHWESILNSALIAMRLTFLRGCRDQMKALRAANQEPVTTH
jgi:hypothetical protein